MASCRRSRRTLTRSASEGGRSFANKFNRRQKRELTKFTCTLFEFPGCPHPPAAGEVALRADGPEGNRFLNFLVELGIPLSSAGDRAVVQTRVGRGGAAGYSPTVDE